MANFKITKRKFQYIIDNINKMNAKRIAIETGVTYQQILNVRSKYFIKKYKRNKKRFKGPTELK